MIAFLAIIATTNNRSTRAERFQADELDHAFEQAVDSLTPVGAEGADEFVIAVVQEDAATETLVELFGLEYQRTVAA